MKMYNIEGICLSLDHMPEQYSSSYFSILRELCDDYHYHTHQLRDTFCFFTKEYEIYYIIFIIGLGKT